MKTIGLERGGMGTSDSARKIVAQQLLAWGVPPDGFVIRDGSGLSRHDLVSPETIVRVLDRIQRDTAFAVFYNAMPIAGVDGTLKDRMKGTPAEGNVHAKTGSGSIDANDIAGAFEAEPDLLQSHRLQDQANLYGLEAAERRRQHEAIDARARAADLLAVVRGLGGDRHAGGTARPANLSAFHRCGALALRRVRRGSRR